ncbi:hypothetical protein Slin15195_G069980 [Septoria linicola]|uniref:Uncharacterized protein n=1 Tax=Septoria linicola TaxID=215465 RepID=A0A9Q9AS86_9PEZI|nr:hypothetical protein Slin14017_G102730 [Septoria linicola]USW53679.1 hypothetical protein Slin15195_G069980 [Septoria linicola]
MANNRNIDPLQDIFRQLPGEVAGEIATQLDDATLLNFREASSLTAAQATMAFANRYVGTLNLYITVANLTFMLHHFIMYQDMAGAVRELILHDEHDEDNYEEEEIDDDWQDENDEALDLLKQILQRLVGLKKMTLRLAYDGTAAVVSKALAAQPLPGLTELRFTRDSFFRGPYNFATTANLKGLIAPHAATLKTLQLLGPRTKTDSTQWAKLFKYVRDDLQLTDFQYDGITSGLESTFASRRIVPNLSDLLFYSHMCLAQNFGAFGPPFTGEPTFDICHQSALARGESTVKCAANILLELMGSELFDASLPHEYDVEYDVMW